MKRALCGAVLCGGKSRRLGTDKAELEIRPGTRQLDYLLGLLEPFCQRRVACLGPVGSKRRTLPEGVAAAFDAEGMGGPMAGVVAALEAAVGLPALAVACDMPFLESRHLVQLLNRRDPDRLATAFRGEDGRPEPLCAVYEAACLPRLRERAASGQASLRAFLLEEPAELVDPDEPAFLASVNDAASLAAARERLCR